jgi:PAS domain S-box-containing protein
MSPPPKGQREEFFPPESSLPESNPNPMLNGLFAGIRIRILALVLLALLPALGLMLHLSREHRKQITTDVNRTTLRLSRFMAASLERDIQSARIFLSALSHSPVHAGSDRGGCPEFLTKLDIQAEIYDAVGVADSTGRVRCQIPAIDGPGRLDSMPWFQLARASSRFSVGYDLGRDLIDKATMDFGFPTVDSAGRTKAVYYCALDLQWMNRLADRLQLPPGAALTVTDREGRTLVRYPNPELWVGKNHPDSPLSRLQLQQAEGVMEGAGLDGVIRLYAFSHVDGGDLSVRIGIPRGTAYAEADSAMVRNLIALALVGLVAMSAAWAAGHFMVVRQANRLAAAAKSLAAGNLETRTGMPHHSGEFGQLARAFDEMAESLEWREAQLRESESERSQTEGRLSEVVERSPDAILGVDEDFSLRFCNPGAERMFGWPRADLEGMDLDRLQCNDGTAPGLAEALLEEGRDRIRTALIRADGTPFQADVSISRGDLGGRKSYTLIVREPA